MNENQSRHPEGTSLGGQWAPGSSPEVDLDDHLGPQEFDDSALSLTMRKGDDGILRYPDTDALVDDLDADATDYPDVKADLSDPDSVSSRSYDALDSRVPGLPGSEGDFGENISTYSEVRGAYDEIHPGMSAIELDSRFAKIEFCAQRMSSHLQGADDDRETDEIDEKVAHSAGSNARDSEALVRSYSSHLQRQLGLLEASSSRNQTASV